MGQLISELVKLIVGIGDALVCLMQVCLLGDARFWADTFVDNKNENLGEENYDPGSWLYANEKDVTALANGQSSDRGNMLILASENGLSHGLFHSWKVPNILYSPENIFANRIAALDANYINPHKYTPVNDSDESATEAISFAESISPTIASWYRAFRNIAIVGLLSVLVYIGIRILIGTVSEKAKYKERLTDWFIALCLVFFMHFIMAGIMMISDKIIDLFDNSLNSGIIVKVDDGTIFRTSFIGYIRFVAQSNSWTQAVSNGIMYLILIAMTIRFTFIYMKRALYLAFFTMISPLVAITYPIDKIGDTKAQAFNMWIKEYFINAILQPMHLILYSALVGAAITLVVENPIYGIVALLFISTAEKWIKKMFKIDQATLTSSSLGDVAVLGSMFNMGKNMIGGIAGGVKTLGIAAATGGIGAVGSGLASSMLGKGLGAPFMAGKSVLGKVGGLMSGGVEDTAGGIGGDMSGDIDEDTTTEETTPRHEEPLSTRDLMQEVEDDDNPSLIRTRRKEGEEKTDAQRAQEIASHTRVATEKATPGNMNQGQNIDDISGVPKASKGDSAENASKGKNSEYENRMLNDLRSKKITEKDPQEEIRDVLNKGLVGMAGGIAGLAGGAFMAGLTGDNKMIPAVALGGVTTFSNAEASKIEARDSGVNRNVKMLVKNNIKNNNIIKNAAELGNKRHWSEEKTLQVAKLAEAFPELKKDSESRNMLREKLKEMGVNDTKREQAIKDIIAVQSKALQADNRKEENAKNSIKKWK